MQGVGNIHYLVKERDLLQQKLKLMQEFYRLTELQQNALSSEDMEQFNELIAGRQQVIDKINTLDGEMVELPITPVDDLTHELAGEIAGLREKIQGCLQMANSLNQTIRDSLEKSLKDVMHSIGILRVTKQTENMYRDQKQHIQGFFLDKQT